MSLREVGRMAKENGKGSGPLLLDVAGYRERIAGAVEMAVSELIAADRGDAKAVLNRMVAAYFLLQHDHLVLADIARIMDKTESWVRYSTDYINRRMRAYYAFKVYIDQTMATYAVSSS
jgi:hypothetical protein